MGLKWEGMEFFPPVLRRRGEYFIFWQAETRVGGKVALRARAVVDNAAPYPREAVAWARINPPDGERW